MNILIGYASVHGTTAEVARFMGEVFREHDFSVKVVNVEEITRIDEFDAFVIGSAIHSSTILPSMAAFIRRFKDDLTLKPVYFWITCVRVLEPYGERHALYNYIPYSVRPGIAPRQIKVFAGSVDLTSVNTSERWAQVLLTARQGDFRRWDDIQAWTLAVAQELAPAAAAAD